MSRMMKCLPRAVLVALFTLAGSFALVACDEGEQGQPQQPPPTQQPPPQ